MSDKVDGALEVYKVTDLSRSIHGARAKMAMIVMMVPLISIASNVLLTYVRC